METITGDESVVCNLSSVHYIVYGCVGVRKMTQRGVRFDLVAGVEFGLICGNVLPYGCQEAIDITKSAPRLKDSNGNSLDLQEVVLQTMRFWKHPLSEQVNRVQSFGC